MTDPHRTTDEELWERANASLDARRDPLADPELAAALAQRPEVRAALARLARRLGALNTAAWGSEGARRSGECGAAAPARSSRRCSVQRGDSARPSFAASTVRSRTETQEGPSAAPSSAADGTSLLASRARRSSSLGTSPANSAHGGARRPALRRLAGLAGLAAAAATLALAWLFLHDASRESPTSPTAADVDVAGARAPRVVRYRLTVREEGARGARTSVLEDGRLTRSVDAAGADRARVRLTVRDAGVSR